MSDPQDMTVDEVVAYAEEHPDEIDQLIEEETAGKARSTLLSKLEALRDAQTGEAEEVPTLMATEGEEELPATEPPGEPPPSPAPEIPDPSTFRTP